MIRIKIHVHPGSKVSSVGGSYDGHLEVHVRGRAVDGAATIEALRAVAIALNVHPRDVTLARGASSRSKVVEISGDESVVRARLDELLALGHPDR